MDSSVFAFVEDLRGEGVERVLDRISGYGATGVTVGAVHHAARDITPHGLSRLTVRGDAAHLAPPADLFSGLRLRPPAGQQDAFDGLPTPATSAGCACTAGPCSCATPRSAGPTPT